MNSRIPQSNHVYERKRARESNSIPHSNLRVESPSGYRAFSSTVDSGSAVSDVAVATAVSVGSDSAGVEVTVFGGTCVEAGSVGVSKGTTDSVGPTVNVSTGPVACGVLVAVTSTVVVGVCTPGVSTGED